MRKTPGRQVTRLSPPWSYTVEDSRRADKENSAALCATIDLIQHQPTRTLPKIQGYVVIFSSIKMNLLQMLRSKTWIDLERPHWAEVWMRRQHFFFSSPQLFPRERMHMQAKKLSVLVRVLMAVTYLHNAAR
jgi:hypothetical protein